MYGRQGQWAGLGWLALVGLAFFIISGQLGLVSQTWLAGPSLLGVFFSG